MTTAAESSLAPTAATDRRTVEARRARPVLWWATFGALCWAAQIYLYTAWIVSGDAKTVSSGPTEVPLYMQVSIRAQEVVGVLVMLFVIYWFLVRPWRRDGRLSWDSWYLIAAASLYWQDLFTNFTQVTFAYNAHIINWGSWFCRVPGWVSPNGCRMVEAPVWGGTWYTYGILGAAILGSYLMRKVKERYPQIGAVGLVAFCFAVFATVDLLMEFVYMRLGTYAYPGAVKGWTLFYGHYYQFPIYEMFIWGAAWTAMICLRYFRNDKGHSVVERGIDRVQTGAKSKSLLRGLALCGALNAMFLVLYQIPINFVQGLNTSTFPADIVKRSYFTQGLCGAGTQYACPSPAVPINRANSVHLDPEGNVVVPPGVKLPALVPHEN